MSKKDDKPKRQPTGDYEVGFAKPPVSGQFKKGETGNPKGRRHKKKKMINRAEYDKAFMAMMEGEVTVRFNGKERRMSAADALLHQILAKALGGDHRSQKLLIDKFEGKIKIEEIMKKAEESRLPDKVTVEFVESDGQGNIKRYDRMPRSLNAPDEEEEDWLK